MRTRLVMLFLLAARPVLCGDWDARRAADYLDSRQQAWFAWPAANAGPDGPCFSCHTGLTYLLARPELRRALHQNDATSYETGLLDSLRRRVSRKTPLEFNPKKPELLAAEGLGVESVMSALFLTMDDAGRGKLRPETELAFDRMWSLQLTTGAAKGAWNWFVLDLDPWEQSSSPYYGAALAALAVGSAPAEYRARPAISPNLDALKTYLATGRDAQPLHHRLALAWASTRLPGLLSAEARKAIVNEAVNRQEADGGWTIDSLGPWPKHPNAPPETGANAYATAWTAFVLERAGTSPSDPALKNALSWLRAHQDPKAGFWDASSMNKKYPADSIPLLFMRDAATAFASLALLDDAGQKQ